MHAAPFRALPLLFFVFAASASAKAPQVKTPEATVEDTGSTNRPGLRVTIDREGHASVETRDGEVRHAQLPTDMCKHFFDKLEAAGPLNTIPKTHCMKSASFGSALFVEFNGQRSPDLSCGTAQPRDAHALHEEATQILNAARDAAGIHSRRIITIPAPVPPK